MSTSTHEHLNTFKMNIEAFRSYCLSKERVTEGFPFGEDVLVFKVLGKMFVLTGVEDFESINLKVDPEKGAELREQYPSVIPAYHMNKKHWVTVMMNGGVPDKLVKKWVDDSYDLVVSGLPKKVREKLLK